MNENPANQLVGINSETKPKTLIDKLREEYLDAMRMIDVQSPQEVQSGNEMKAIMTFTAAITKISDIHEQLSTYYTAIWRFQDLLIKNQSQRLRQLGHELLPTYDIMKDIDTEDIVREQLVLNKLHDIGLRKKHWYFKERYLLEIEYMLDSLTILIEPDFMPITSVVGSDSDEEIDRYIPSEVKLNVWRRDQGKCVECGSKEKLEYDHIIPITKGGSNTERNIQLLCQACNRKKATLIK
jgi:hypothetical protein